MDVKDEYDELEKDFVEARVKIKEKCDLCGCESDEMWHVDEQPICKNCYEKDVRCKGCGIILDQDDFDAGHCNGCA